MYSSHLLFYVKYDTIIAIKYQFFVIVVYTTFTYIKKFFLGGKNMLKRYCFLVGIVVAIMVGKGMLAYASEIPTEEEFPYVVDYGATYWESSWNFGTGRHGIVNEANPYTTMPYCYAAVNGYAYLNEGGEILAHDYIESESDIAIPPAPEGAVKLFKHFKSTSFRNGWVDADNVSLRRAKTPPKEAAKPTDPEEIERQDAEELAEMIQQYEGMTIVIVDRSSSMDDFAAQATKKFRSLSIDEQSTKVYIFGRYFKEIQAKDIAKDNRDVRQNEQCYDYLAEVINDAAKYSPKHIIILTDLGVYEGTIASQPELETIDILVPSNNWYGEIERRSAFIKKAFPNVKINIRQFDE